MKRSVGDFAAAASSALLLYFASRTDAYRIQGSRDENKPFVPYEKGFVGNVSETVFQLIL